MKNYSYQQNYTSNLSVFGQINTTIDEHSQPICQLFHLSILPPWRLFLDVDPLNKRGQDEL